ncbi:MAG TPA: MFS transporter [Polyangiaceae bacterium]|nr:MFS transporter [Polyangiaceae bacterium]
MAGRFPLKLFLFAFFGWVFDFYDLVLLGFLKDAVGKELGFTHASEGWILGTALGASGIGGLLAGHFADRWGKRRLLALTVLIYSLGSLVCGLAPSVTVFVLGRAIVGLGVGGEWAIGHSMLAEAVKPELRGRASGLLQAGEPVGVMLAAIMGFGLLPIIGWRAVLVGSSVTALLAVFARRSMHLPDEPAPRAPLRELLAPHIFSRVVRAFLLGTFKLGTYWTCYTWLPRFLREEMHQGVGRSLTWVLTAQVGQLLGMLSFGWVADRIGRRPAFFGYSLLTAAAIAPLAFAWRTLSDFPPLFWTAMFCLGLGSGCTAGFGALLAELFPTELRTTAMGTTYNLARGVQLGAPVLVGYAVAAYGLPGGLGVPLVLALATASWVWVLPETRGIELMSLEKLKAHVAGQQS